MELRDPRALGAWIKEKRIDAGLRQIDVANAAGITASQLSRIENGLATPTFLTAAQIAKALNVSINEMEEAHLRPPTGIDRLADLLTDAGMDRRDALTIQNRLTGKMRTTLFETLVAGGWPSVRKAE